MTGPWSDMWSNTQKRLHRIKRWCDPGDPTHYTLNQRCGISDRKQTKDKAALIKRGGRNFFVTPWRGCSIIGTTDTLYEGSPDNFAITETDIQTFLDDINASFPTAKLKREEVYFWVGGMRPMGDEDTILIL